MDIGMLTIKQISQLLENPELVTSIDKEYISLLNEKYPYFTPGRYLQAARRHTIQPFSADMMTGMQLYSGNWLMFYQFLNNAANGVQDSTPYFEAPVTTGRLDTTPEMFTSASEKSYIETIIPLEAEEALIAEVIYDTPDKETVVAEADTAYAETQAKPDDNKEYRIRMPEQPEADMQQDVIEPLYVNDYFRHEGVEVSEDIPGDMVQGSTASVFYNDDNVDEGKSLIVVRNFSEWLNYLKHKNQKEQSDEEERKALKALWQRERLAAAIEEDQEEDEIPEDVFEMAVNSIAPEDGLISESLAEIMTKQGKYERAIDMYRKLSLRNPEKNAYFANKIEEILKQKNS